MDHTQLFDFLNVALPHTNKIYITLYLIYTKTYYFKTCVLINVFIYKVICIQTILCDCLLSSHLFSLDSDTFYSLAGS